MLSIDNGVSPPSNVAEWFAEVEERFCPYIAPALREGVIEYRTISLQGLGETRPHREASLFYEAVALTEALRERRDELLAEGESLKAQLTCTNLLIEGSESSSWREAKNLVDWPHFLLKNIYSRSAVMFGKFWTHEEQDSRYGKPITPPPITFLSIRSSIRVRDPLLLSDQEFKDQIASATPGTQDLLLEVSGVNRTPIGSLVDRMRESGAYSRIRESVERK